MKREVLIKHSRFGTNVWPFDICIWCFPVVIYYSGWGVCHPFRMVQDSWLLLNLVMHHFLPQRFPCYQRQSYLSWQFSFRTIKKKMVSPMQPINVFYQLIFYWAMIFPGDSIRYVTKGVPRCLKKKTKRCCRSRFWVIPIKRQDIVSNVLSPNLKDSEKKIQIK